MSAEARFRSLIDRILRLREEQDEIGDQVKQVYAEAKGEGYDKTAMGALVAELRKREKNSGKFEEASAILELYRDTYLRAPSHTYASARTREQASSGMASETMDPSADHVSPPARNRDEGSVSANAGGGHEEVSGTANLLIESGSDEEQASLAAREGEEVAAPVLNAVAKAGDDVSRVAVERAEAKAEEPEDAEPVSRGEVEREQEPVADPALAPVGRLAGLEGVSAEPQPAPVNPHCQKPETCKWARSLASCSPCANAAMLARRLAV